MSANNRNRLKTTVSAVASSGLGAFTISTASSGYRSFVAGDDGLTFDGVLITEGTTWEVRDGCVYTHSGTSLSRGTLMDSSTGSAIAFTSAAVLSQGGAADFARRAESAGLRSSTSSADANLTMQVGVLHCVDISGFTADRTATLPAVAAVDDRVGLYISTGDDAYEMLITAASGDTLAGIAGGTEWSRVFITGEIVVLRCIVANTTWIVEEDGRIATGGLLFLSTDGDGEAAATWTLPTSVGGAWTTNSNTGTTIDTSTGKITVRRAGKYNIAAAARSKDALVDQKYYIIAVYVDGVSIGQITEVAPAAQVVACQADFPKYTLAVDKYLQLYFQSQDGGVGIRGQNNYLTHLSVQEQL